MFDATISLVIFVLFAAITFLELLYYYVLYARFSFRKCPAAPDISENAPPVSVIMVVKDAAAVLLKTLPRLLNQHYPNFELVVVNDNSKDDTRLLLLEYQQQYDNIHIVNLDSAVTSIRGNKYAMSIGIRCAKYENMIFTDAECAPSSMHWLEQMAGQFSDTRQIVLGYSTYQKRNNPFNRMLHFDNLLNALQYFSLALAHSTYRGNHQNIGFTKTLFYKQRGFASHNHLVYGDEDIFISKAANRKNTAVVYDPDSFTVLQRPAYYNYWVHHKEGLYYTRKYNTFKNKFLLNFYSFLNIAFYVSLVFAILATLSNIVMLSIVLGIALLRIISLYLVFGFAAKRLNEKQTIPALLFYDLIFAILNPIYYLSAHLHHQRFK
ncbi:MAG: glycosyltransferase [Bacteroidales bacterium]|nr:glycosyltransferase [Bacteroidales bacterium]